MRQLYALAVYMQLVDNFAKGPDNHQGAFVIFEANKIAIAAHSGQLAFINKPQYTCS